jgi:two-component sensor histidine kinase
MKRLTAGEVDQFAMEKRYCRKDGSTLWVNLTVSPTWKDGQRPRSHIAIVEDITRRKQAEQRLVHVNQTLEERVRDRTAQLVTINGELEGEVRQRQRIEVELRQSLEEKDTLLREIHHRVKNNLAVVSSLFYLESTRLADAHTIGVLTDARHRVRSMAMVHEELYRSRNLDGIEAPAYLQSLTEYLLRSHPIASTRVAVATDIDMLRLNADAAIPCGLILTELLTNCFKHAFPSDRTGTITVTFRPQGDDRVILAVSDDGGGIAPGTSIDNGSSLGLRLVRSLARQLDGTFAIESRQCGTEARVTFPAKAGVA